MDEWKKNIALIVNLLFDRCESRRKSGKIILIGNFENIT